MASCSTFFLIIFFFFLLLLLSPSPSSAQQSFRPKSLLLPVSKSASTLQYTTLLHQRTPLVPVALTVDLGGQFLWVDCQQNYSSSTYRPSPCRSAQCHLAGSTSCGDCYSTPAPGCNNNTCGLTPDNSITHTATGGELASDVVSVQSTDGSNPGPLVSISRFLFSCAPMFLLQGLASGVSGMAGLGRTRISLPSQFSSAFSFHRKFAICLTSSTSANANGVIIFGNGPYRFLPNIDASQGLQYTPLIINPVSTASAFSQGDASSDYFIGVTAIKVDDKTVAVNKTLLSIDNEGIGGTKISTVNPYTVLEASIFEAVTTAFVNAAAARNISRVGAVAPFEVCFSTQNVASTRLGYGVPTVYFMLQNETVSWSVFGANSMVQVSDDVICLGFVNGGKGSRTSVVIGGYQLENNLVEIDLARSRLGFSSLLFGRQTTCSNFNFTSNA